MQVDDSNLLHILNKYYSGSFGILVIKCGSRVWFLVVIYSTISSGCAIDCGNYLLVVLKCLTTFWLCYTVGLIPGCVIECATWLYIEYGNS